MKKYLTWVTILGLLFAVEAYADEKDNALRDLTREEKIKYLETLNRINTEGHLGGIITVDSQEYFIDVDNRNPNPLYPSQLNRINSLQRSIDIIQADVDKKFIKARALRQQITELEASEAARVKNGLEQTPEGQKKIAELEKEYKKTIDSIPNSRARDLLEMQRNSLIEQRARMQLDRLSESGSLDKTKKGPSQELLKDAEIQAEQERLVRQAQISEEIKRLRTQQADLIKQARYKTPITIPTPDAQAPKAPKPSTGFWGFLKKIL